MADEVKQDNNSQEVFKSKKQFYRGMDVDDLKALDVRECAKYLPSRSRRTLLRNFQIIEKFVKRAEKKVANKKRIRTHMRDLVIVPRLVGMTIAIYNGKSFEEFLVTGAMIGHRLGEFALTRKKVAHSAAGIGATKSSKAAKK